MSQETQDRIRITEANLLLINDTNDQEVLYKLQKRYLRGAILETVLREFLNEVRKDKAVSQSDIEAGDRYSVTVDIREIINIDTLERTQQAPDNEIS